MSRIEELEKRRDELQARLDAIRKDIGKGLSADWEEQAQELENAEVLDEIARVAHEELNKVEAELSRLRKAQ